MVLNGAGDNVVSSALISIGYTFNSKVIGIRSTAGKNNLIACGTDKRGTLITAILNGCFRFLPKGVEA